MTNWSELPYDLLLQVAYKLKNIQDFAVFSAVCRSWHYAITTNFKGNWNPIGERFPWLMLSENGESTNVGCYRKLYNPNTNKLYEFKLPQTLERRCWGTSCGWLMTLGLDMEIHLLNPLTGTRLRLPPVTSFEHRLRSKNEEWFRKSFIYKVIVLKIPPATKDMKLECELLVMITFSSYHDDFLAFVRPGDHAWTLIEAKPTLDIALCNDKIFLIDYLGNLWCIDVKELCKVATGSHGRQSDPRLRAIECMPRHEDIKRKRAEYELSLYLFEESDDLFLVMRTKSTNPDDPDCYKTVLFEVYKLDLKVKEWKKIDDLGDTALFVGNNCTMSIQASSTVSSYCKPNCIYFNDDETQFWRVPERSGGHDMGVFDMKTSAIEKLYAIQSLYDKDDCRSTYCCPLWFIPMI